jgi:hypothetical protein
MPTTSIAPRGPARSIVVVGTARRVDAAGRLLRTPQLVCPAMGVITERQVNFLEMFGYLCIPGLFADDIEEITEAFEAVFADPRHNRLDLDAAVHRNDRRIMIPGFIDLHPTLAKLREDERIVGTAHALLGDDIEYAQSDGNLAFCHTEWHADIYSAPMTQRHIKFSFYLDPLRADSGAIRVLPGTHFWQGGYAVGLRQSFREVGKSRELFGVDSTEIPATTIDSDPGDVLVWDYRIIHASFNGLNRRRYFSVNFQEPVGAGNPGR